MNITTNCNRTSHWLNIRFFHQYFPCLCKIKRKVIRSKNCGISQKKKRPELPQHTIVKPYPHTLSQSRLTSTSKSCLHCVSCSIQPSISCSMWKIFFKDFYRIRKMEIGFRRGGVWWSIETLSLPLCHVKLSRHTLQIISLRRVDKLEIVFVLL